MYSQKDEESYILRAVQDMNQGVFLDIGAYDGYNYSNTMALVDRGWQGVMVEPGLEAFQELLKRHGGNSKLTLVHAVVGDGKWTRFWNNPKTFSTASEANTKRFHFEGFSAPYLVRSVTAEQVLTAAGFNTIDVLSIDTEGVSVDIFKGFPLWEFKPRVVCVEHDGRIDECMQVAARENLHVIMQNEENLIFVR